MLFVSSCKAASALSIERSHKLSGYLRLAALGEVPGLWAPQAISRMRLRATGRLPRQVLTLHVSCSSMRLVCSRRPRAVSRSVLLLGVSVSLS